MNCGIISQSTCKNVLVDTNSSSTISMPAILNIDFQWFQDPERQFQERQHGQRWERWHPDFRLGFRQIQRVDQHLPQSCQGRGRLHIQQQVLHGNARPETQWTPSRVSHQSTSSHGNWLEMSREVLGPCQERWQRPRQISADEANKTQRDTRPIAL